MVSSCKDALISDYVQSLMIYRSPRVKGLQLRHAKITTFLDADTR
jgi:hypothetical protein